MAVVIGEFDTMLRGLEATILQYVPRCEFYFGQGEEALRQKSPPYVAWAIGEGEPSAETRETAAEDRVSWLDDGVRVTARCAGAVLPGQQGKDLRRQQLDASLRVMLAVSWAVVRAHQGYFSDLGWRPLNPEQLSDAHYPVDYTFAVRAGRRTPEIDLTTPTSAPGTVAVES